MRSTYLQLSPTTDFERVYRGRQKPDDLIPYDSSDLKDEIDMVEIRRVLNGGFNDFGIDFSDDDLLAQPRDLYTQ